MVSAQNIIFIISANHPFPPHQHHDAIPWETPYPMASLNCAVMVAEPWFFIRGYDSPAYCDIDTIQSQQSWQPPPSTCSSGNQQYAYSLFLTMPMAVCCPTPTWVWSASNISKNNWNWFWVRYLSPGVSPAKAEYAINSWIRIYYDE